MILFASTMSFLLIYTSILLVTALAGLFSERSGVLALSLEGNMTIGSLFAGIAMNLMPGSVPAPIACIVVIIAAIIGGMLYSFLHAVACITFKANQTLIGIALNILAVSIAVVGNKVLTASPALPAGNSRLKFTAFYEMFNFIVPGMETVRFNWLIFIILALLPLAWFILYKTKFGLRLRACGENPRAADSAGINVTKIRYVGVLICGALSGLGGLALILTGAEWEFASGANGFGFLALAVLIFGQWKPFLVFLGSLIFALFKTISVIYPSIDFLASLNISSYFYLMLPYIVCLIALIFISKKNKSPKDLGNPYDKGNS
ncbi:MAG: ABC transporter permease [Bacilli bacterium]|nr:ABC transporter permease [Bacilli bacterium]